MVITLAKISASVKAAPWSSRATSIASRKLVGLSERPGSRPNCARVFSTSLRDDIVDRTHRGVEGPIRRHSEEVPVGKWRVDPAVHGGEQALQMLLDRTALVLERVQVVPESRDWW